MSPLWYTAYLIKLHSTTGRNSQWTFTWIVQCSGPLWKALDSYPLLTTFVVPNWHTNLWDPDLQNRHLHILHPHPSPSTSLLQGQEPSFFRPNKVNSSRRVAEYLQLVEQWNRSADSAMDLIWCSIYHRYTNTWLSCFRLWSNEINKSAFPQNPVI